MTAPTAPASLREDVALREALARSYDEEAFAVRDACRARPTEHRTGFTYDRLQTHGRRERAYAKADAILAGPLAARDAERDTLIATLRARCDELRDQREQQIDLAVDHARAADRLACENDALKSALAAAQARIAEMERALAPFAKSADSVSLYADPLRVLREFSVADLRAARSALHPEETHDER